MNDTDWIRGILADLSHEPDRSLAIIADAYLDDLPENGLRVRLRGSQKSIDAIFRSQGFLDSLAAKTKIAQAIGFIDDDEYHDLEIIRRIRNKFTHIPNQISFQTPEIADMCNELKYGQMLPELQAADNSIFRDKTKQRFIWSAQNLAFGLWGRYQTAECFQEPEPAHIPGGPRIESDK